MSTDPSLGGTSLILAYSVRHFLVPDGRRGHRRVLR